MPFQRSTTLVFTAQEPRNQLMAQPHNQAAIQASMSAVFATGTFTAADAEEFTAELAAGHLDGIYALN
jgi:hypothetical protein